MLTLNTDDPAMFRTSLVEEYRLVQDTFGFTDEHLRELARNSFEASFLPAEAHLPGYRSRLPTRSFPEPHHPVQSAGSDISYFPLATPQRHELATFSLLFLAPARAKLGIDDIQRVAIALQNVKGKRLTYKTTH
jgi:hypothetical protein